MLHKLGNAGVIRGPEAEMADLARGTGGVSMATRMPGGAGHMGTEGAACPRPYSLLAAAAGAREKAGRSAPGAGRGTAQTG